MFRKKCPCVCNLLWKVPKMRWINGLEQLLNSSSPAIWGWIHGGVLGYVYLVMTDVLRTRHRVVQGTLQLSWALPLDTSSNLSEVVTTKNVSRHGQKSWRQKEAMAIWLVVETLWIWGMVRWVITWQNKHNKRLTEFRWWVHVKFFHFCWMSENVHNKLLKNTKRLQMKSHLQMFSYLLLQQQTAQNLAATLQNSF